jgi:DNA-binding SARP family transcriptional activator/TolB-like protein
MSPPRPRSDPADQRPAFRLKTLGQLGLDGAPAPGEGPASRPRSLALLAILAAGEEGVPRDKLLLYLWPESNTQRARNSLHQTLYAIRRHLGQEAVLAGATNLQLNPRLFSTDLWDFEDALGRGAIEEAIDLYGGPFLDGFSLPDLPEFGRWVEEQRLRTARRFADALEVSATRALERGDHRLAVDRWQALQALEPLSSRPVLGLMQALVALGDRASALEHARAYETLINRQLDAAPDPAVTELVERLRARSSSPAVIPPEAPEPAAPVPSVATAPNVSTTLTAKVRRLRAIIALLVAVDVIAIGGVWYARRPIAHPPMSPDLLVVLPFKVVGSPEVQYLDTGLVDLLTTNLEGAGRIRSVDTRALLGWLGQHGAEVQSPPEAERVAARFGAGLYLLGTVVEGGGRIHLRASLYDRSRDDGPVASAAVQGEASDVFTIVDRLTGQLLAKGTQGPVERLSRVAATTTGSIEALKQYLAGERELRGGRFALALESYQRALAMDSSFALAYYRLSIAAEWLGQDSLSRDAAAAASRFGSRLSEHDRLLVEALAARREGRIGEAERLYRKVVDDHPDDVEAWFQLGQVLFHGNPLRGRSATEARAAFERVVALDPENHEAVVHLARIAFIEGRRRDVDTLVRRVLALAPDREVLELRAFRAFALGDREAHKRVTREMVDSPPDVPPVTALQVAVYLDDVEGVDRFARLLRAGPYSDEVRGLGYRLMARVAAARGRWQEARAQLDTAGRFNATAALELRSLLAMLPFLQVPRAELLEIRSQLDRWQPEVEAPGVPSHSAGHAGLHPFVRLYRLGLLDAILGDTAQALRWADALERAAAASEALRAEALRTFAKSVRARAAMEGGRFAEALALLEQANWELVEPAFESEALHRYYRAELLRLLGRDAEALDWYRTIAERATYELVYVAPSLLRRAEIYRRQGDRARAAEAYRRVADLWRNADPPLESTVAQARELSGR